MPLRFSDAATTTLSFSITTTQAVITVESVASFPQGMVDGDYFIAIIANTENTVRETIKVTAIDYSVKRLFVQRGYDNTTPIAWPIGSKVEIRGGSAFFKEVMLATMEMVYPVGSIYTNAGVDTNPTILLGFGTWTSYAAGRVLVGVNPNDPAFDQAEEIGGSKDATVVSHTHTASSIVTDPGHRHWISSSQYDDGNGSTTGSSNSQMYGLWADAGSYSPNDPNFSVGRFSLNATTGVSVATSINSTGSSGTNANLQPYITVYMWKRTA